MIGTGPQAANMTRVETDTGVRACALQTITTPTGTMTIALTSTCALKVMLFLSR